MKQVWTLGVLGVVLSLATSSVAGARQSNPKADPLSDRPTWLTAACATNIAQNRSRAMNYWSTSWTALRPTLDPQAAASDRLGLIDDVLQEALRQQPFAALVAAIPVANSVLCPVGYRGEIRTGKPGIGKPGTLRSAVCVAEGSGALHDYAVRIAAVQVVKTTSEAVVSFEIQPSDLVNAPVAFAVVARLKPGIAVELAPREFMVDVDPSEPNWGSLGNANLVTVSVSNTQGVLSRQIEAKLSKEVLLTKMLLDDISEECVDPLLRLADSTDLFDWP